MLVYACLKQNGSHARESLLETFNREFRQGEKSLCQDLNKRCLSLSEPVYDEVAVHVYNLLKGQFDNYVIDGN